MTYAFENRKMRRTLIPRVPGLDRRVKLTDLDRKNIRELYLGGGWSQRGLAGKFDVSRRLIVFTLYPDRKEKARLGYKERRKDGRYYVVAKHRLAISTHRHHKRDLYRAGKLIVQTI